MNIAITIVFEIHQKYLYTYLLFLFILVGRLIHIKRLREIKTLEQIYLQYPIPSLVLLLAELLMLALESIFSEV